MGKYMTSFLVARCSHSRLNTQVPDHHVLHLRPKSTPGLERGRWKGFEGKLLLQPGRALPRPTDRYRNREQRSGHQRQHGTTARRHTVVPHLNTNDGGRPSCSCSAAAHTQDDAKQLPPLPGSSRCHSTLTKETSTFATTAVSLIISLLPLETSGICRIITGCYFQLQDHPL